MHYHTWLTFADACNKTARLCDPCSYYWDPPNADTRRANANDVDLHLHPLSSKRHDALDPNQWQYNLLGF